MNGQLNGKAKIYYFNGELCEEKEFSKGKLNGTLKNYNDLNGKLLNEKEYVNGILYKGKEYNYDGELRFECEYLYNSIRKGRDYINGRLEYEGEYLFNRKYNGNGYDEKGNIIYELNNGNGKVKEYDAYCRLIFEGEYLNGKRWNGKIKEYDNNDNLIFEGEYLNGKQKSPNDNEYRCVIKYFNNLL